MRAPIKKEETRNRLEIPPTKDGFRYYLCIDDDPLCKLYIDELEREIDTSKKYILPAFTKRKCVHTSVTLSEHDRAIQLKLSEDSLRVTGERGYSMVRATHAVNRGKWYYEVYIDKMPAGSAARVGWGQRYANLHAPLGYDEFGYSYRSRSGTKFHQARGRSFDDTGGYKAGDTIGCMIELPYGNDLGVTEARHLPPSIKDVGLVLAVKKNTVTGYRVIEEKDSVRPESTLKPLPNSKIMFYKNGKFIGVAFEDIFEGFYFPTISLYKECTVVANFGPSFKYPPEDVLNDVDKLYVGYRDFQQAPEIEVIDQLLTDICYIVENENKCKDSVHKLIESCNATKN